MIFILILTLRVNKYFIGILIFDVKSLLETILNYNNLRI